MARLKIHNGLVFLLFCGAAFFCYLVYYLNFQDTSKFNEISFKSRRYSKNDIIFFSDIAFRECTELRKWNTNIMVEIDKTCPIDFVSINDLDSIIKIFAPLIAPIKITRVEKNGNLIIHMNVQKTPAGYGIGYTLVNDLSKSTAIISADVYTVKYCRSVLPHEFEHAIGLSHPTQRYPFYNTIGINDFEVKELDKNKVFPPNSIVFETWKDYDNFMKKINKEKISEQEKIAIKMLYSSDFKSGLKRKTFQTKMGMQDERN
jgi:hypothetical protein